MTALPQLMRWGVVWAWLAAWLARKALPRYLPFPSLGAGALLWRTSWALVAGTGLAALLLTFVPSAPRRRRDAATLLGVTALMAAETAYLGFLLPRPAIAMVLARWALAGATLEVFRRLSVHSEHPRVPVLGVLAAVALVLTFTVPPYWAALPCLAAFWGAFRWIKPPPAPQ
ncbi:MAG: hypothetical protein OWU84_04895 [Firmicutes bacterium]|nr:hypothetical protein [Bacillota bacterium]